MLGWPQVLQDPQQFVEQQSSARRIQSNQDQSLLDNPNPTPVTWRRKGGGEVFGRVRGRVDLRSLKVAENAINAANRMNGCISVRRDGTRTTQGSAPRMQDPEPMADEPATSSRTVPGQDPVTGRLLPGHQIGRRAKERKDRLRAELYACPSALEGRGLGGLWELQVKAAEKGSAPALSKLWDLIHKYGMEEERASSGIALGERYAGLPDEVGQVLRELDMGIAEVVHRGTVGLPMSDVEQLIFETAQALRAHGPKCVAVTRWRGVLIREIQELREQKGSDDDDEQNRQGTDGVGASRESPTTDANGHTDSTGRADARDDDAAGDEDGTGTVGPAAGGQAQADDSGAGRQPVDAG